MLARYISKNRALAALAASALALLSAAFFFSSGQLNEGGASLEKLTLVTSQGPQMFDVEIADTEGSRRKGLMFRREMGDRQGMLFLYDAIEPVGMWMKNTYIPLDMVFIGADGRVRNIARETRPFSEQVLRSDGPVKAVLELNGGMAAKIGLQPGDEVQHPRLRHAGGP